MNTIVTLIDLLKERKKTSKGITFINGSDSSNINFISYHDMYHNAVCRLGYLQAKGLKKGSYAIFQLENNEEFLTTFWACLLGNIIPIPIAVGLNDAKSIKFFHILRMIHDAVIITTEEIKSKLLLLDRDFHNEDYKDKILQDTYCVENMHGFDVLGEVVSVTPDTLAFVQFSSGSTGEPKGVMLTHENLLTNIRDIQHKANISEQDEIMSWLPLTHDMGIIGFHLVPVLVGANNYIMPTNLFARNPIIWMNKIDEYRATIISSPNFGYKLFMKYYEHEKKKNKEFHWDLSCVRLIFNGAEPISVEIAKAFMDLLKIYQLRETAMYFVYGMAEACLGITFPEPEQAYHYFAINIHSLTIGNKVELADCNNQEEEILLLADCGCPLNSMDIRIVDKEGNLLEDGYVGRIQIKGRNVTKGYYQAEEYTRQVIDANGWLNTGDIGVRIDSRLLVTGREKDIIIVNGVNYYATDIEEICEKGLQIKPGGVVACSLKDLHTKEEVLGLFIHDTCKDIEVFRKKIEEIHSYLSRTLGLDAKYILPTQQISKTTSGKVQHYKLVEEYNEHKFDHWIETFYGKKEQIESIVISEQEGNVEKVLKEIICEVLEIDNIEMDSQLLNYCGSSLKVMEIQERINQVYTNGINISDIYECTDLNEIAELLRKRNGQSRIPELNSETTKSNLQKGSKIAITGMDIHLPSVDTIEELREVFCGNGILKKELSDIRKNDIQMAFENISEKDFESGFYLDRIDTFDWEFFHITPKEAELLSPVQRLFLQSAYKAIQDAGYTEQKISNTQTGVFIGYISDLDNYKYKENIYQNGTKDEKEISVAGNLASIISGRLSHYLNLHGPSMIIDTACSSSLSAMYLACQSIYQGDCDTALVGGIRIKICPVKSDAKLGIESENGVLRAFDDKADGTEEGEGCITLFLKEYEEAKKDRDPIYAVILSGALNQDGKSANLTSPSADAQSKVLTKAWSRSGIVPERIGCIEAHGTGTKVGDIIELEGISKAFSQYTQRKQFCGLSTSKSYFGHTYDLAGLLGAVKMVLQLKYKELYGIPNLSIPNTKFEFQKSPIWLVERYQKWESEDLRIGGVSAFGFSGTNCHIVLSEAEEYDEISTENEKNMLVVTAKSKESLLDLLQNYGNMLLSIDEDKYDSFCYSVNRDRDIFQAYKVIILSNNIHDLRNKILCAKQELLNEHFSSGNIYYRIKNQIWGDMDQTHPYYSCIAQIEQNGVVAMPLDEKKIKRMHIPTYSFQPKRVWFTCKNIERNENKQLLHTLQWKEVQDGKELTNDFDKKYLIVSKEDSRLEWLKTEFSDTKIVFDDQLPEEMKIWEEKETIQVSYLVKHRIHVANEQDELKEFVTTELKSLLAIIQSLNDVSKISFVLVVQNAVKVLEGDVLIPELSMLMAMVRSASVEMPHINFKVIDCGNTIEKKTLIHASKLEHISWIAIRDNHFYGGFISELVEDKTNKNTGIKKNGTYLFTGAMGAIGLSFVTAFIDKYDVNVMITGRKAISEVQQQINELTEKKKRISYYSCDIANEEDVNTFYKYCLEKRIHINGIFHLAGVPASGLLVKKDLETMEKVLAPKVYGIHNLLRTFGKNHIDFLFLFSSGMVLFPEIGQCEYVMANQYLDAISEMKGDNTIYSVNWPVISDSGMAKQYGYSNQTFLSINSNDVFQIVETVLLQNEKHVLIGKWQEEDKKDDYLRKYGYLYHSELKTSVNKPTMVGYSRVDILNELCEIIQEVTGLQMVDPNESFLEKGVDSILLVRIHKKIGERFPDSQLSISQMFTLNTIQKLADKLYQESNVSSDALELQIRNWLTQVEEQKMSAKDMADQLSTYDTNYILHS